MSPFIHWAIAHGVHYGPGKYLPMTLIMRREKSWAMINEWERGIVLW